jgi:hypothetical protein
MSLTNPKRSHFFSWLYGKSKEDFRKSLLVPDSCERIGFSESPVGVDIRPSRAYFPPALCRLLPAVAGLGRAKGQRVPLLTAEARELPAAVVQAWFLAQAWVLESVWACV